MLPASAGMILRISTVQDPLSGAPRIRGDDTKTGLDTPTYHRVLPASAGMILALSLGTSTLVGAPRIRGDDPSFSLVRNAKLVCSPHPRG